MGSLKVIDKEKINSIINASEYTRIYAVRKLSINVILEIAVVEEDGDVLVEILRRLISLKDTKDVIDTCKKLSKARDWVLREFIARRAPIDIILDMAVIEEENDVLDIILEKLEAEKDSKEVIEACDKLAKANDWRIREFVAKIAPINIILEMAAVEEDDDVLERILERLEPLKDTEEVINTYIKISKYLGKNSYYYRNMPIEELIKMVEAEGDEEIIRLIDEMS